MQRISDSAGFIRAAAIDHPENYQLLFDSDLSKVSFEEVVESKLSMISAMQAHATALLLDPVWAIGQTIATAVAPGVGIITGLEALYYTPGDSPMDFDLKPALRPNWTPAKLSLLGVDAAKLVVFYRHDFDDAAKAHAHDYVRRVAADCAALQLPLIVEPLWFPNPGEDLKNPTVAKLRTESVISAAGSFRKAGADIMKVEFPTLINTEDGKAQADAAVERMAEQIDGTWVLLSAGVTFEGFAEQLKVGIRHGCSGFMAGRAIWGDAIGRLPEAEKKRGERLACERLDKLAEIMASGATPSYPRVGIQQAAGLIGADWHKGFGE